MGDDQNTEEGIRWSELKKLPDKLNLSKRFPTYVHKWVFRTMIVAVALLSVVAGFTDGLKVYQRGGIVFATCPSDKLFGCKNPFYDPFNCKTDLCKNQTIAAGSYVGEPPSPFLRLYPLVVLIIVLGSVGLNHLLYVVEKRHPQNAEE